MNIGYKTYKINISYKIIILCIFVFLLIISLYIKSLLEKKNIYPNIFKKQYGGQNTDCQLNEVMKHNTNDNKWVYINGTIYDISPLMAFTSISDTNLFRNISLENVNSFMNLIKSTGLQDLHKILNSYESYNAEVDKYNDTLNKKNEDEPNSVKSDEFLNKLEFDTTSEDINKSFSNFKLLLIISLKQFRIGIICPAGLTI